MESNDFVAAFVAAEVKTIDAFRDGPTAMDRFKPNLLSLVSRFTLAKESGQVDSETIQTVQLIFRNIKDTTSSFIALEKQAEATEITLLKDWSNILSQHTHSKRPSAKSTKKSTSKSSKKSSSAPTDDASLEETSKFRPCRDYFLEHLGAPYPNASQKGAMADAIGCPVSSVNQWFTNYRRRVGWLDVMKVHAQNNKDSMKALVDAVTKPKPGSPPSRLISDIARQAVLDVKEKVTRLTMPNVSDIFREALMMEPMSEDQLAEFAHERKMARQQVTETAAMKKELEERKQRKAARAKARANRLAAAEAEKAKRVSLVKRKRNDENDTSAAHVRRADDPRRIKKVRIAQHEEGAPVASTSTIPRTDLPFATTDDPSKCFLLFFFLSRVFLIYFIFQLLNVSNEPPPLSPFPNGNVITTRPLIPQKALPPPFLATLPRRNAVA